jgi:hypothetical protein
VDAATRPLVLVADDDEQIRSVLEMLLAAKVSKFFWPRMAARPWGRPACELPTWLSWTSICRDSMDMNAPAVLTWRRLPRACPSS